MCTCRASPSGPARRDRCAPRPRKARRSAAAVAAREPLERPSPRHPCTANLLCRPPPAWPKFDNPRRPGLHMTPAAPLSGACMRALGHNPVAPDPLPGRGRGQAYGAPALAPGTVATATSLPLSLICLFPLFLWKKAVSAGASALSLPANPRASPPPCTVCRHRDPQPSLSCAPICSNEDHGQPSLPRRLSRAPGDLL
ncbi:MAG: hypothetical protein J3K34DRAFT_2161 [Monoraphidium minutum]|nr:MAG: hypothetical protein J3K34DRAFT_2161 [Monoraphidium minutum]